MNPISSRFKIDIIFILKIKSEIADTPTKAVPTPIVLAVPTSDNLKVSSSTTVT